MSRIEIHIIAYNEHIMLPFTLAHYKKMFKDPLIIVHDNYSTDDTVAIAEAAGCKVVQFQTDGMNDTVQSQIKSDAALNAKADWVLCIDADEECFIDEEDLADLDARGINAVQFHGWNIFDTVASPWDIKLPMGVECTAYAKPVLLRTGVFDVIKFAPGAHSIILTAGKANFSIAEYKLLHYKHWSCDWNLNRSTELAGRQSEDNKKRHHSFHFAFPKEMHESYFNANFAQRQIIVDRHIEYAEGIRAVDLRPDLGDILIADKNKLP